MISKIQSRLSILLILAMLFSFTAVAAPAAPAKAAPSAVVLNSVSATTIAAGNTLTFNYTVTTTDNSYSVRAFMDGPANYFSDQQTKTAGGTFTLDIVTSSAAVAGTYTVYVTAGGVQSNTMSVKIDATKPTGSVSVAETCWTRALGATPTYTVTYTGAKSGATTLTYLVELSNDGGANYDFTVYSGSKAPGTYTVTTSPYALSVPNNFYYAMMRIRVTDTLGLESVYAYSSSFYILPTSGASIITPTVTYPTGTVTKNGGDNMTITGTIFAQGPSASYMLTLFPNGDPDNASAVYENITSGWKNFTVSGTYPVSYSWKVSTSVSSSSCIIVLYAKDCSGFVTKASSSTFTIVPTTGSKVVVNYPTSGAVLYSCATTDNITFTLFGGTDTLSTCNFYSSTDNKTWGSSFAYGSFAGGRNSITFPHSTWTAGTYYVKIEAVNNGIATLGYSPSFTLKALSGAPTLTMSYPNGSESLTGGTVVNVTYVCRDTYDSNVPIEYYIYLVDSGASTQVAHFTAKNATGSTSTYSWAVNNITSANCKIKIVATDPCGNAVTAESANAFSITAGCAVETQNIALYSGWNLVSLPLVPISTDINSILSGISGDVNAVYYYTGGSSGRWTAYVPGVTTALSTMEAGKAYWIEMKGTPGVSYGNLAITGRKCPCASGGTMPTVSMYYGGGGWNLVGFKSTIAATMTQYMQSSGYSFPVFYFNPATQQMVSTYSSSTLMQPGYGYWFYVNSAIGFPAPCQ